MTTKLIAFIEAHGFLATANTDGSVSFWIPWVGRNGETGSTQETVRSFGEARIALGY